MLALNLAAVQHVVVRPTGVKITRSKAIYSAVKNGFGLEVHHQAAGVTSETTITELVNVTIHEIHARKIIYTLGTEVNAAGIFSDFHFIPINDIDVVGITVSLQLYMNDSGDAIPGSGFKITKRIFDKILPSDDRYCSIVKEPWSVQITHHGRLYQSKPGTGSAAYHGKLRTA